MKTNVMQFRISLRDVSPVVWRRILVPDNYNFWELHVAIQDAMGWTDCHPHVFQFRRKNSRKQVLIGIPDSEDPVEEGNILPGWEIPVKKHFNTLGDSCLYEYDFGDGWVHDVLLEGFLLKEKGQKYPQCLDGYRACPPENCGGPYGYCDLLRMLSDPENEGYEEAVDWLGEDCDPEKFNPDDVKFDDPKKRLKKILESGM